MRRLLLVPLVLVSCDRPQGAAAVVDVAPTPVVAPAPVVDAAIVEAGPHDAAIVEAGSEAAALAPFEKNDWKVALGAWTFEDDGTVRSEGVRRSSVLYRKGIVAKDVDVSVDVSFLGNESSAGIVVREQGDDFMESAIFYQFEWYTEGTHHDRRLSIMKKDDTWRQMEEHTRAPEYERWYRFRMLVTGDRLQGFIDGERVVDVKDREIPGAGRVGLHVYQPRKVRFRDFRVTRLDSSR